MKQTRLLKPAIGAGLTLTAALAVWLVPPSRTAASDHIDSPLVAQDRAADIGDQYAFLDPNDNSRVVLMMSTQNFIVSSEHFGMGIFDSNQRYRFEIENTGDAKPDEFIDVSYSPGLGRLTRQTATVTLPNGHKFQAPTTIAGQAPNPIEPVITTDQATGTTFYAGVADDPFFLDDTGANRFVASAIKNPGHPDKALLGLRKGRNTYAGFNTLITALDVPVSLLRGKGNVIGINAVTQRLRNEALLEDGEIHSTGDVRTADREGVPFVNNVLIPAPLKNLYNASTTQEDSNGKFRPFIVKSLKGFGTDDEHILAILKLVQNNGDILRLDTTVPNTGPGGGTNPDGGFMHNGGRRLQDDVATMTFTAINNGKFLSDNVFHDEQPFRNTFPFVANPNQPYPPGNEPDNTRQ